MKNGFEELTKTKLKIFNCQLNHLFLTHSHLRNLQSLYSYQVLIKRKRRKFKCSQLQQKIFTGVCECTMYKCSCRLSLTSEGVGVGKEGNPGASLS